MSVSILIHDPRPYYTAGSTISGAVHLTGKSDIDVSQIMIAFSGRSESTLEIRRGTGKDSSTDYYHGRVNIFHYDAILFTGPRTLHPNQHSWDFGFRFPLRCDSRGGDKFVGMEKSTTWEPIDCSPAFNDNPQQALPPSFHLARTSGGPWRTVYGDITYQLEARLVKDHANFFNREAKAATQLLLKDHRFIAEPDPQPDTLGQLIECKSMHLLPGYEDRSLTLMEKFKSIGSKTLPAAAFHLTLIVPRVCVMGWGVPMFLGIDHDLKKSTSEALPVVYLKSVQVTLETQGTVRCVTPTSRLIHNNYDQVSSFTQPIYLGEFDGGKNPPPITERMDLRKMLNLHLAPEFTSPRLRTCNFEVHHALKVKVVVVCAHKTLKAGSFRSDLQIMPELYMGPTHAGAMIQPSMVQAQAPPYAGPSQANSVPVPRYEDSATVDSKSRAAPSYEES